MQAWKGSKMDFQDYFYKHPYTKELDTEVISCIQNGDLYDVVLKNTIFYPEGGGQPSDQGFIQELEVFDVQRKEDVVVHTVAQPLQPGSVVHIKIDWEYRFDMMQNHTAEHIFSGVVHQRYHLDNVGFHMSEYACCDFNGELSPQQIRTVEKSVNQAIWQNLPVKEMECNQDEVGQYTYRSKKEIEGMTRIVSVDGYDSCACCGMHVLSTGEIGICKVVDYEVSNNHTRVWLVSGRKAFVYLSNLQQQNQAVSHLLSAPPLQIESAVKQLIQKRDHWKQEYEMLAKSTTMAQIEQIEMTDGILFLSILEQPDILRAICNACIRKGAKIVIAIGVNDTAYNYVMMSKEINLKEITNSFNELVYGKGGGNEQMIQGSCHGMPEEIVDAIEQLTQITMTIQP